jgi:low affinity Fe/Cu permease
MEIIHQQVQRKKEKMARLADLQRKIDEAIHKGHTTRMCQITIMMQKEIAEAEARQN